MSTFALETELMDAGFDLHQMRKEWKEVSEAKGWPLTEIGWSRYLERTRATGQGPKAKKERVRTTRAAVPVEFIAWWQRHRYSGYCKGESEEVYTTTPHLAWACHRYRVEWDEHHKPQTLARAA